MSGLNSVISAVAFQIDQVLRPALQPVANALFNLSDSIFNAEGAAGDLIGILGAIAIVALPIVALFGLTAGVIAAVVAGFILLLAELGLLKPAMQALAAAGQFVINKLRGFANAVMNMTGPMGTATRVALGLAGGLAALLIVGKLTGAFALLSGGFGVFATATTAATLAVGAFNTVIAAGTVIVGAFSTVVGIATTAVTALAAILGLPVIVVAALIAAIAALIAIFATDFMGIRTAVMNALGGAMNALANFGAGVKQLFGQLVNSAVQWGADLMRNFAQGIMGIRTAVMNALGGAMNALANFGAGVKQFFGQLVNSAVQWGADLMRNFAKGIMNLATAPLDAAREAFDRVAGVISFDQAENDRMARGWGRDLLTEFSVGMSEGASSVDMSISPGDTGGGGDGRPPSPPAAPPVMLDGKPVNEQLRKRNGRHRRARQRDGT
jgi:hypothetical protein